MEDEEFYKEPKKMKSHKIVGVKNKMPAPVQITAEQLLREAKERELEITIAPPTQKITSYEELSEFKLRKRKDYEDNIRKNRLVIHNWIKYAAFEESQGEIPRARSVYERALDVDHRNVGLWLKYAEMEMRLKQVNHARNLWDRAVSIMPRVNQFWYKYTYMEEMLGNPAAVRQVFERWMEWQPEEQAWMAYINFEMRYKEIDRARLIYEKFILIHPDQKNWIKYAKFEERNQYISNARQIFERAIEFYGEDNPQAKLLLEFSRFEERHKEHDRARVIYKYALDNLLKEECTEIYKAYTIHEKKYGDRTAIENVILSKRRFQYEEEVQANPHNYDAWFDYLRLVENESTSEEVREIYERAIANVPPINEKSHWRRYIYLWINYALYEELVAEDADRTRQVYQTALEIIPHKKFTFAKLWLLFAMFEIRQKNLTAARKILGTAIGKCPKDKLFRGYIDLEIQLREFDRCRKLYEKFLEHSPESCTIWIRYAEMESILGDIDRARAIFELAVNQPRLDMPELLWKSYIDLEVEQKDWQRGRDLYRRLLEKTGHVKVWLSFANFELGTCAVSEEEADKELDDPDEAERLLADAVERSRSVYKEANNALKDSEDKEQRVKLLEAWKEFEENYGSESSLSEVQALQPEKIKRRRRIETDTGEEAGWEEYVDYLFPDKQSSQSNMKLLAMAKRWKEQQERQAASSNDKMETSPADEANPTNKSGYTNNGVDTNFNDDDDDDDEEEESSSSDSD